MRTLKDYIRWCTRAQRTLAVLALMLLAAFYLFAYGPITRRIAALQHETLGMQSEVRSNRSRSEIRNEIAERNARLRQELDRIKKPATPQELPDLINDLRQSAEKASLKTFAIKPGSLGRGELFSELPYVLTMEGDFVNVFAFLQNTEQMKRLTRVRSMTLKSKDPASGQVTAQVSLNTYFTAE